MMLYFMLLHGNQFDENYENYTKCSYNLNGYQYSFLRMKNLCMSKSVVMPIHGYPCCTLPVTELYSWYSALHLHLRLHRFHRANRFLM